MKYIFICLVSLFTSFNVFAESACYNKMEKLRKEALSDVKSILSAHPECQASFDKGEKAGGNSCPKSVWDQISAKLSAKASKVDDACTSDQCIDQIDACMEIIDMNKLKASGMNGVKQRIQKVNYTIEKKSDMDTAVIEI